MDYVVAGLGIGAVLALIGFALWEVFGDVEEPGRSWLSRVAIGLMIGSLVIWSITIVSLISHTDDSRGSNLVLVTTLVTLVAIAAGGFWYWRADRALAATRPRAEKTSVQRDAPATATLSALSATGDIELTEWDSWPERVEDQADTPQVAAADEPPPSSFEPEVAAEAAVVEIVAAASAELDAPGESKADSVVLVTEDTVIAESVATVDLPDVADPADTGEQDEPEPELPPNVRRLPVRQLPTPAVVDAPSPADEIESAVVAKPAAAPVPEPESDIGEVVARDVETIELKAADGEAVEEAVVEHQVAVSSENPEESPAFESALLSDVDSSLAADDGGYRSPLLSDLGPDQLEGVGLARWRPEARLTDEDDDHIPPAKTGRR